MTGHHRLALLLLAPLMLVISCDWDRDNPLDPKGTDPRFIDAGPQNCNCNSGTVGCYSSDLLAICVDGCLKIARCTTVCEAKGHQQGRCSQSSSSWAECVCSSVDLGAPPDYQVDGKTHGEYDGGW